MTTSFVPSLQRQSSVAQLKAVDYTTHLEYLKSPRWFATRIQGDDPLKTERTIRSLLDAQNAVSEVHVWQMERDIRRAKVAKQRELYQHGATSEAHARKPLDMAQPSRETRMDAANPDVSKIISTAGENVPSRAPTYTSDGLQSVMVWTQLRQRQPLVPVAHAVKIVASTCAHPMAQRLKRRGGGECRLCQLRCRQVSFKCLDCAALLCARCHDQQAGLQREWSRTIASQPQR